MPKLHSAARPAVQSLVAGAALILSAQGHVAEGSAVREYAPRLLQCTLGHALDLDPTRLQSIGEVKYEGAFPFALYLPAARAWQGELPDPGADPEPVDPAVRIVADPVGIAADMDQPFMRVIDLWPERVELIGQIRGETSYRLLIVSDIDAVRGTANLFMTRAADAASLDLDNVYQGGCTVTNPAIQATSAPHP